MKYTLLSLEGNSSLGSEQIYLIRNIQTLPYISMIVAEFIRINCHVTHTANSIKVRCRETNGTG